VYNIINAHSARARARKKKSSYAHTICRGGSDLVTISHHATRRGFDAPAAARRDIWTARRRTCCVRVTLPCADSRKCTRIQTRRLSEAKKTKTKTKKSKDHLFPAVFPRFALPSKDGSGDERENDRVRRRTRHPDRDLFFSGSVGCGPAAR